MSKSLKNFITIDVRIPAVMSFGRPKADTFSGNSRKIYRAPIETRVLDTTLDRQS